MKLKSISFENYKAFYEKQTMQLKPITILIGKNSSGKSSIAKLFTLFENSLSGEIDETLLLNNYGVELGEDFKNLFFGNSPAGRSLNFNLTFENDVQIEVMLFVQGDGKASKDSYGLKILEWKYKDDRHQFELKLDEEGESHFDESNNRRIINFKGFIPNDFPNPEESKKIFDMLKIDVDYIGPFRTLPERYFYLTGQTQFKDTGISGKNAYSMLGMSKYQEGDKLHQNVGSWYEKHFDGWKLEVENKSKNPLIQILLTKDDISINLVDVGQGMNQALPLVVRANVHRPDSIVILEQPELHLHPAAHADLAELFARSAKENDQTFIIETHSENILLRIRKLIVENDFGFTKDDLAIYWIEDAELKGKELKEIIVDENGVLDDWPEGVFNESLKEILEMQNAIKRKQKQD